MKDSFKRMFRNVNPAIVIIILILLVNKMLNSNQSIGDWLYTQLLLLPGIIIGLKLLTDTSPTGWEILLPGSRGGFLLIP